jgi:hypothetical protein
VAAAVVPVVVAAVVAGVEEAQPARAKPAAVLSVRRRLLFEIMSKTVGIENEILHNNSTHYLKNRKYSGL